LVSGGVFLEQTHDHKKGLKEVQRRVFRYAPYKEREEGVKRMRPEGNTKEKPKSEYKKILKKALP